MDFVGRSDKLTASGSNQPGLALLHLLLSTQVVGVLVPPDPLKIQNL